MIDRIRGEVTARISFLHSFTKYAMPTRIQFPIVQSRLMITPEKVLCSMLNHSTSAETLAQVKKKIEQILERETEYACKHEPGYNVSVIG